MSERTFQVWMWCLAIVCAAGLSALIVTCESPTARLDREKREAWVAPCQDTSVLLATTAGSPNQYTCPNQNHRMRVQVSTEPTNEEAAALVICECTKPQGKAETTPKDFGLRP